HGKPWNCSRFSKTQKPNPEGFFIWSLWDKGKTSSSTKASSQPATAPAFGLILFSVLNVKTRHRGLQRACDPFLISLFFDLLT
ncbi:hypothetical protein POX57_25980, partial [Klebsiella pneumoniae]